MPDEDYVPAMSGASASEEASSDDSSGADDSEVSSVDSDDIEVISTPRAKRSAHEKKLLAAAIADLQKQRRGDDEFEENIISGDLDPDLDKDIRGRNPDVRPSPPAPSFDPEVQRLREEISSRISDLDKREASLLDREKSDPERFAERYPDNSLEVLKEFFRQKGIATTDDEWKAELTTLVSEMTEHLGFSIPDEIKTRNEARRSKQSVQIFRRQQIDEKEKSEKARLQQENDQNMRRAREAVSGELKRKEHAESYPWLITEEDPASLVLDVVQSQFKKDGTTLRWTEAARRANDYIQNKAIADADRRRHLLERVSKPRQALLPQRQQEDHQEHRRSETEVRGQPTEAQEQPKSLSNKANWNETHRQNTKRMMRRAFKPDS